MPVTMGNGNQDKGYKEILVLLRDKIINNWNENSPEINDIKFNFDWNDDSGEYIISLVHNLSTQEMLTLGSKSYSYRMFAEIHLFVKQLTEEHPTKAANIEKEILRILFVNSGNLGNGITYILPVEFVQITQPNNTNYYWHSVATVQLSFYKFIT